MKHYNPNDNDDIRNWKHQGIIERIKITIFIEIVFFIISLFLTEKYLPLSSDFGGYGIEIGFIILTTVGTMVALFFNIITSKHNKKVKEFKNMTAKEQKNYLLKNS